MSWKTAVSLVLAIVFGLVAAVVGRNLIQVNRAPADPSKKYARIVAAAKDVAPGQELSDEDLGYVEMSVDSLPRTSFKTTDGLKGRVAVVALVKGQPLLESSLAEPGAGRGLQAVVPDGMRAVTIEVNEVSGLAGLLTPGCRVDVISTIKRAESSNMARTIVENVKVMAIGPNTVVKDKEGKSDSLNLRSITLLVTPKQAETIELACSQARPRLVLRGTSDNAPIASAGVTSIQLTGPVEQGASALSQLLDKLTAMKPTTQPAAELAASEAPPSVVVLQPIQRSVQVIRGGEESVIHYEIAPEPGDPTAVSRAAAGTGWNSGPRPVTAKPSQNDPFAR